MKYMTDMNDGLAIHQAMPLQAVANDLHTSLNSLSNPKTYKSTDEEKRRLLGYSISIVVLRALAVELTLKALAFKRTGKYCSTHNLLKLHTDLGTDTQALISKIEDIQGIASVERILEKHKNDFVDWRYTMEMRDGGKMHVQLLDICRALDVLLLVYSDKDFPAICDR